MLLQLEIQKRFIKKWPISNLCDKLNDYVIAGDKSGISDNQKDNRQHTQNENKRDSNTWRDEPSLRRPVTISNPHQVRQKLQ